MEDIKPNGDSLLNLYQFRNLTSLNFQVQQQQQQQGQQSNLINKEPIMYTNNIIDGEGASGGFGSEGSYNMSKNEKTNLIINYLPEDMVERELREMFGKYGKIRHLKIIRDPQTGFSYAFGFVNFEQPNSAAIAQFLINGREVRGKRLKVSLARPRSQAIKNAKLYVSRLPPSMNEMQLRRLFGLYGNILDVNILLNKFTGRPRGVAFIRFDQHMAAEMAVEALDQYLPPGSKRHIDVRFVVPKIKPPLGLNNDNKWRSPQVMKPSVSSSLSSSSASSSSSSSTTTLTSFQKKHNNNNYRQYLGSQNGTLIYDYQPQQSNVGFNNLRPIPKEPPQEIFAKPKSTYYHGYNNHGFNKPGFNNSGFNNHGFKNHGSNNPGFENSGFMW